MRSTYQIFSAIVSLFFATQAFANAGSSCHFHGKKEAAESAVLECAEKKKEFLIDSKKIDVSWKEIKSDKIEKITTKNGKLEWKLTFKNSQTKETSKQTLYMFFSMPGNFLASNFTGE